MRVSVDRDKCIGAGHCATHVPEVFAQGEDDGVVILLEANPAPELQERVREAAALCPARVIILEED
jgi:ferredoxin